MLKITDIQYQAIEVEKAKVLLGNGTRLNFCNDCGMLNPPIFMLKDNLWREAVGAKGVRQLLCLKCTEDRLGYPISKELLTPAPCNYDFKRERWMDQRLEVLMQRLADGGCIRSVQEIVSGIPILEKLAILLNKGVVPGDTPEIVGLQLVQFFGGSNESRPPRSVADTGVPSRVSPKTKANVGKDHRSAGTKGHQRPRAKSH